MLLRWCVGALYALHPFDEVFPFAPTASKVYFLTTLSRTHPPGFRYVTLLWQRRWPSTVKSRTQISYGSFSFTSPKLGVPRMVLCNAVYCIVRLSYVFQNCVSQIEYQSGENEDDENETFAGEAAWWASVEKCVYNLEHLRDIVPRNIIVPFLHILSKEWGMVGSFKTNQSHSRRCRYFSHKKTIWLKWNPLFNFNENFNENIHFLSFPDQFFASPHVKLHYLHQNLWKWAKANEPTYK